MTAFGLLATKLEESGSRSRLREPTSINAPAFLSSAVGGALEDQLARPLRDLRISVTDRCNFRCVYCMPKSIFDRDYVYLPQSDLLSFAEITRIASIFVSHGVEKIRITGGEPLLRKNLETLIAQLSALRTASGQQLDITLTTNGSLLAKKAQSLKDAGLTRVTVSLDALDDAVFRAMNDVDFSVTEVLEGIEAAHACGMGPIKINMVVKRGVNEHEILPMARHFKGTGSILRFIEYMDVGGSNAWNLDEVLSSEDIRHTISSEFPLEKVTANYQGETAERWRYLDGGEIGFISSVSKAFCGNCTRARLSTEGKLYTCLFATSGYDLRKLLRGAASDTEISARIAQIWHARSDQYSQQRSAKTSSANQIGSRVEMSYIGG